MARAETDLIMVCTSDIAGQVRGKAVPRKTLDSRRVTGVGWTPTNVFITAFGPIAPSPWGALGDLSIRPDWSTQVDLDLPEFGVDESFVLGTVTDPNGAPWDCCLRSQLAAAAERLRARHGLTLLASFEHEFHYFGADAQPGLGYALRAFRRVGPFANRLMAVLDAAGLDIDTFMPEYGPGQYEVTIAPKPAVRAADEAVILRELVRATARGLGSRPSFAPILDPAGVGNGVHVHFSLLDESGAPVCRHPTLPETISHTAGAFLAGVLKRMPEYLAMTAASVASYYRLTPRRWSAAFNNLGRQDREAGVRLCPVFDPKDSADAARQFHFEYRAADGAASPYLLLAALLNAGLSGLDEGLPTPPVTNFDLAEAEDSILARLGVERLDQSLDAALNRLADSAWARDVFGPVLIDAVVRHKRAEIAVMRNLTRKEICSRYAAAY